LKTNDVALYDKEYFGPHAWLYSPIKFLNYAGAIMGNEHYQTVLDVGCGTNKLCDILRKLGIDAVGLDFSPHATADVYASVTDIPFDDNSFDIVCSFDVLEHLEEWQIHLAIPEMIRVCRHRQVHHICLKYYDNEENDPYHCTQKDRVWWLKTFAKYGLYPEFESHTYISPTVMMQAPIIGDIAIHYWTFAEVGYVLSDG
jgi:SAM-dependent methyltransferase